METTRSLDDAREPESPPLPEEAGVEKPPAWELIAAGRYRPRRIRGSLLGRELG
jgi:hypothetical protein